MGRIAIREKTYTYPEMIMKITGSKVLEYSLHLTVFL